MAENSSIEWCDATFNPVRGCTKVSEGCRHCYAARDAARFPAIRGVWGDAGTRIVAVPDYWKGPVRWNRQAAEAGVRRRVFCASLADIFENWKGELRFPADMTPDGWLRARWDGRQLVREYDWSAEDQGLRLATMDDLRTELFRLMEATPALDWLLLTKRPQNVMRMVPEHWRAGFPGNIWMGTTVENQAMAEERIPQLLRIPARVRFLSCEPLLGRVDLSEWLDIWWNQTTDQWVKGEGSGIHWVIAGGESGPQARPMHPDWPRALRRQCAAAGKPFFFKQWGEFRPAADGAAAGSTARLSWMDIYGGQYGIDENRGAVDLPANAHNKFHLMERSGKRASGRLLDGVEHSEFPSDRSGSGGIRPQRLQLSRAKGWRMPENTVRCCRPGPWGNPFVVAREGQAWTVIARDGQRGGLRKTREEAQQAAVSCYKTWIRDRHEAIRSQLRGRNLACFCPVGTPCHADVLLRVAND